jgi:signal transduction histidine kinase
MISVVSHELRTPLASLVGFAELLLMRDFSEDERREILNIMVKEGHRLTALTNEFLDLQRLESGRSQINPMPTALTPLLEHAIASAGEDPARPITLEVANTLPPVQADADRILQVLANLLSNARKYSPHGGTIRVTARCCAEGVEIAVQDHGLGIPLEALPHVFEKFYRVEEAEWRAVGGAGLGLAICRSIVEAHGGRIWATSAGRGAGSMFTFTLPLAEPAEMAQPGQVSVDERQPIDQPAHS